MVERVSHHTGKLTLWRFVWKVGRKNWRGEATGKTAYEAWAKIKGAPSFGLCSPADEKWRKKA